MGLRTVIKNGKAKAHGAISDWLKPKVSSLNKRHRIAARIRLANRWATKNPKKTSTYVVSSLLAMFVMNIIMTGARLESQEPKLSEIAQVEPIFDGFRRIQANKEDQRRRITNLTKQGSKLKCELDSLIAIPDKSNADSVLIINRYKQLESIVTNLTK